MAGRRSEGVYPRLLRDGRTVYDATWSIAGRKYWKKGLPTRADAVRARRDALGNVDRGRHVTSDKRKVGEYLAAWAATREDGCRLYVER